MTIRFSAIAASLGALALAACGGGEPASQPAPDTASGIAPQDVGRRVIDAVREGEFYIITHDDYRDIIAMRHQGILDALDAHARRYGSTSGREV